MGNKILVSELISEKKTCLTLSFRTDFMKIHFLKLPQRGVDLCHFAFALCWIVSSLIWLITTLNPLSLALHKRGTTDIENHKDQIEIESDIWSLDTVFPRIIPAETICF